MKKKHLTAANGRLIADNQNSQTAGQRGPVLMQDPWLIEKLALPTKLPPEEYANDILALAKKNGRGSDDITVAVAYVHERGARAKKR